MFHGRQNLGFILEATGGDGGAEDSSQLKKASLDLHVCSRETR